MATLAAEIPREHDLLGRLASGTAGVVGTAFLRRLVTELAGALDAELAFVAELNEHAEGWTRTVATAGRVELGEGVEIELAGTPCEHAYEHELLLVRRGARLRYPASMFLREHQLDGYLAIVLRGGDGQPIGHMAVIATRALDPAPSEVQALRVFGARAAAELERRRHERALRARADEVAASRARAVQAADDERRRIGRDLHDGAQQRLVVLGAGAGARAARPGGRPGARGRAAERRTRAGRGGRAASCASWRAGCTRSGSSAGCAARSPRSRRSRRSRSRSRRCPTAACRPSSRPRSGSSSPRR